MRQDDGVDLAGWNGELRPIAQAEILQPLKQTAVHEHALPAVLEQIFRPGHRAGGTQKRQVSHSIDDDIRLTGARPKHFDRAQGGPVLICRVWGTC